MSDSTTLLSAQIGDVAARRTGAATVFQNLSDDLTMHVHLENNILFPRYEHAEEVGR
jgi:iron-sulfur cluster repair protein YtfE (RIC family)